MTVHGAKGLEAPIVILADTTTPPKGPKEPRLLQLPVANAAARHAGPRLVWAGRKADDVTARCGRARRSGARRRRRISAASLCGDDARGRSPGGRGLARRNSGFRMAAGTSLSRGSETGGDRGASRRWRQHCVRWRKSAPHETAPRQRGTLGRRRREPNCPNGCAVTHQPRSRRAPSRLPRRWRRSSPIRARCCAGASCIACCRPCPPYRPNGARPPRNSISRA